MTEIRHVFFEKSDVETLLKEIKLFLSSSHHTNIQTTKRFQQLRDKTYNIEALKRLDLLSSVTNCEQLISLLEVALHTEHIFYLQTDSCQKCYFFGAICLCPIDAELDQEVERIGVNGCGLTAFEAFRNCMYEAVETLSFIVSTNRAEELTAKYTNIDAVVRIPGQLKHQKPVSSEGCAAASNIQMAIEHGFFELMERHAIYMACEERLDVFSIQTDTIMSSAAFQAMKKTDSLDIFERCHFLTLNPLQSLWVSVCILCGCRADIPIVVGLGCHYNFNQAIEKSYLECLQLNLSLELQNAYATRMQDQLQTKSTPDKEKIPRNKITLNQIKNRFPRFIDEKELSRTSSNFSDRVTKCISRNSMEVYDLLHPQLGVPAIRLTSDKFPTGSEDDLPKIFQRYLYQTIINKRDANYLCN